MVSRPDAPEPSGTTGDPDPVSGLLHAWRRLLTRLLRLPQAISRAVAGSRPRIALRLAIRYAADPSGTLTAAGPSDRERLKEAGAAALVFGAALSFAFSYSIGTPPLRAFLALGWTAAWALVRLYILRLALPGATRTDRRRADDAWGPALLPYLVAVVFPLDIIALALSALLTHRGLVALGVSRADARRAVTWAFGGQLAVEAVAWMGRAGLLAFVFV